MAAIVYRGCFIVSKFTAAHFSLRCCQQNHWPIKQSDWAELRAVNTVALLCSPGVAIVPGFKRLRDYDSLSRKTEAVPVIVPFCFTLANGSFNVELNCYGASIR